MKTKNVRKEEMLDGGLIIIKNYAKPSSVKIIDKRNPLLVRIREGIENAFADLDMTADELNTVADELIDAARELREIILKRKGDKK